MLYNIAQIDALSPDNPAWFNILIFVLLIVFAVRDYLGRRSADEKERKVKELENEREQIMSQTHLTQAFSGIISDELRTVSSAIREAATINREGDNANRVALEQNTRVIASLDKVLQGITVQFRSTEDTLKVVQQTASDNAESTKTLSANTKALTNDTRSLHVEVRAQIEELHRIKTAIREIKTDIGDLATQKEISALRTNFIEIYDGIEESITSLRLYIERSTDTRPIPDDLIDNLSDGNVPPDSQ